MSWDLAAIVPAGKYVLGLVSTGLRFDLGTLSTDDVRLRIATLAVGWSVDHVEWDGGVLGFVQNLRVYGRVDSPIASLTVAQQIADAINSFWSVAGATVSVLSGDSLATPPPSNGNDELQTTIQLVATAIIVIGIVWGISQIRSVIND